MVKRVKNFVADINAMCDAMPDKSGDEAKSVLQELADGLLENVSAGYTSISYGTYKVKCVIAEGKCSSLIQWLELVYSSNEIDEETFLKLSEECNAIKEELSDIIKKL